MTITAKIIKDSLNIHNWCRVTTFELEYPRFIHAEIMTHRMFGRNAQSSRAVPVAKTLEANTNFVYPLVYGKNKSGMSSNELLEGDDYFNARATWEKAAQQAFSASKHLSDIGLHKQWANRVTEPFSHIKVVITATEWDNFFWLRRDPDAAQPEIVELADKMYEEYCNSRPESIFHNEWHLPYINTVDTNIQTYLDSNGKQLTLEEALKISASCCAQVSYRNLNDSKEKAIEIYEKLFNGPKPHLSPTEHQAMAFASHMTKDNYWLDGISHQDRYGNFWSGNLKGFIQYRKVMEQKG